MSEKVHHVSLAEQIRAVDRARLIVSGAARPSALAREREYEVEGIEAALRTLRWNHAHEAEIREDWARRRGAAGGGGNKAQPVGVGAAETGDRKRRLADMPLGTQAALRCQSAAFRGFLNVVDEEAAAVAVRRECGVTSRAEFDHDAEAAARWRALEARFVAWLACAEVDDGSASA